MLLINKNHCALGSADVSKESKFSFTGVSEREQIMWCVLQIAVFYAR